MIGGALWGVLSIGYYDRTLPAFLGPSILLIPFLIISVSFCESMGKRH